jgi:hypothetical protein
MYVGSGCSYVHFAQVVARKYLIITSSKTLAHNDLLLSAFTCLCWLLTSLFKRATVSSAHQSAPRKGSVTATFETKTAAKYCIIHYCRTRD